MKICQKIDLIAHFLALSSDLTILAEHKLKDYEKH